MKGFEYAWKKTGKAEGGYSNHPDDPGGETMWGVTAKVARAHGYHGPMTLLPKPLATKIAKAEYWDSLRLDDVHALCPALAYEMFDTNFNLWFGAVPKFLQRLLNALNNKGKHYPDLKVDGAIGPMTIAALRRYLEIRGKQGAAVIVAAMNSLQCADYLRQVEANEAKETFFFGWVWHRVCHEQYLQEIA